MAVHAIDRLMTARSVTSLPEALTGCQRAIATTDRPRTLNIPLETPRAALPWLLEAPAALIFGPEDRGLNNQELNHAQRWVNIPTSPEYSSLNLAQAVAVCCYELHLSQQACAALAIALQHQGETGGQAGTGELSPPAATSTKNLISANLISANVPVCEARPSWADSESPATLEALADYYAHLEAVLLKIGYLYAHTAASRMQKFKRLYNRWQLSANELAMLRGVLRQVEWAISQHTPDAASSKGATQIAVDPVPIADTLDQSGSE